MSVEFKVGTPVTWSSSSNGTSKTKAGVIVKVVHAGMYPWKEVQLDRTVINMLSQDGNRDHESYLVRVDPQPPKQGKSKIYWPRVGLLRATIPA
jgi:hypothetical protein